MVLDERLEYGTLEFHGELKSERGENKQGGASSGSSNQRVRLNSSDCCKSG